MTNILFVDDHPMVCFGLAALAGSAVGDVTPHFAYTFQSGLDCLSNQQMDMIMLDLGLPGGKGIAMINALRQIQPEVKILICSARDEQFNAPSYMQSGANGFLHKHAPDDEIKRAILTVLDNQKYMSERVRETIMSDLVNHNAPPVDPISTLSNRERQVLALLIQGKWLKEISQELNIAIPTVGTQKSKIFQKLKVTNMIELTRKIDMYQESGGLNLN